MSWARYIDLNLDVDTLGTGDNPVMKMRGTQKIGDIPDFTLVNKDAVTIRLALRKNVSGVWTTLQLDSATGVLAGKKLIADTTLLFSCSTWVEQVDGDDYFYIGTLNLNTIELDTALGDETDVDCLIDVEFQNADNSQRCTFQFDGTIKQHVYAGEGDPTDGDPTYPAAGSLVVKHVGVITCGAKTGTADISSFGLALAPSEVLLSVESEAMIFAVCRDITATDFDWEISSYDGGDGTKIHYLVIE